MLFQCVTFLINHYFVISFLLPVLISAVYSASVFSVLCTNLQYKRIAFYLLKFGHSWSISLAFSLFSTSQHHYFIWLLIHSYFAILVLCIHHTFLTLVAKHILSFLVSCGLKRTRLFMLVTNICITDEMLIVKYFSMKNRFHILASFLTVIFIQHTMFVY